MRSITCKLYTVAANRNLYLTTCKGTLAELTAELHSMCPQVASLEISQAIQAAVLQDDCLTFFGGHSFGVEVVDISELKPRTTIQRTKYGPDTEEALWVVTTTNKEHA